MVPQYAASQTAFRVRASALIGDAVQNIERLAVRGVGDGQLMASGAFPTKMVEAEIRGNAIDPCIKRALETKPRQMYVGAQESFLINVLAIVFRAGEMNGEAKDRAVIFLDKLLEGCDIALLRCSTQLRVIHSTGASLVSRSHTRQLTEALYVTGYLAS